MIRMPEQELNRMLPHEIEQLLLKQGMLGMIRFDEQIVPQVGVDAIDPALKERFLRGELPEIMQLKKLYLIAEDENKQLCLTVSGVLLVTARPTDFLSSAVVQCVAYNGKERNAEYQVDAQDCDGSIDQQIQCAFNFGLPV